MPKIKRDEQQFKALEDIEEALRQVDLINHALDDDKDRLCLFFSEGRKNFKIELDKKIKKRYIVVAVRKQRELLISEIRKKAEKFDIELGEQDERILEWGSEDDVPSNPEEENDTAEPTAENDSFSEAEIEQSEIGIDDDFTQMLFEETE